MKLRKSETHRALKNAIEAVAARQRLERKDQ
jgi:hypothetical protein